MKELRLKYNKPAVNSRKGWEEEALPIGNGALGMKVFGLTTIERLQFNEKSLWKGGPSNLRPNYNGGNLNRYEQLKRIQEALENNDEKTAKKLRQQLVGIKDGYGGFMPFGNVYIELNHNNVENYERGLCLNDSISYVSYDNNNIHYERKHFASIEDNCIVSVLSSSSPDSFLIKVKSDLKGSIIEYNQEKIVLKGSLEDNGLKYEMRLLLSTDGEIKVGDGVRILNAKNTTLSLFAATDYANVYPSYRGEDPSQIIDRQISKYDKNTVEERHVKKSKENFEKQTFELTEYQSKINTDVLLQKYKNKSASNDEKLELEELVFAYGKYLIAASSQPGSLPANLQGVWNDIEDPAWESDYHLNVNLQMCYWNVYQAGLFDEAIPLLDYISSMQKPGAVTAKMYHNVSKGWVCHTQNTPFGWTCPGWDFDWGWSPAASSWILQDCYNYYLYTQDKDVLKEKIYPAMKGNAQFWLENLKYDSKLDRYVSSPSYSPEHGPITKGNTYEQEIIYSLFKNTIEAAKTLNDDVAFIESLENVCSKLKPLSVGSWGQIKEWITEDEWKGPKFLRRLVYKLHGCQYHHRHASHLLGLYPYYDINSKTPDLLQAARVSLEDRGEHGSLNPGWSKANKACLYARLKDGANAYKMISSLISENLYDNLWDFHPPYQMDGNCGYSAAVFEMLVYDDGQDVKILPAIPKEWPNGKVTGYHLKGNKKLDFEWKDYKIISQKIY